MDSTKIYKHALTMLETESMQFKSQAIIIEDSWSFVHIYMQPPDGAPWCIRYNITIIHIRTKLSQHKYHTMSH